MKPTSMRGTDGEPMAADETHDSGKQEQRESAYCHHGRYARRGGSGSQHGSKAEARRHGIFEEVICC